jgi:hypothetical protein
MGAWVASNSSMSEAGTFRLLSACKVNNVDRLFLPKLSSAKA